MTNDLILNITRFVVLILAQVFIFDNILLFGFVNPFIYILFLILFPVRVDRMQFLLLGFLLGLTMDFFSDTGGIHAAACLVVAYLRPVFLRFSFGVSIEYNTIKISNTPGGGRLTYIALMVLTHHLVLFFLEIFSLKHTLFILKSALFSSIFTILLSLILMVIFSTKKR
jgi:rod shape-determining protein MreD